jgi:hypothetical protein
LPTRCPIHTKAFIEFVLAFILAIGLQLQHKATCDGDGSLIQRKDDSLATRLLYTIQKS